MDTNQIYGIVNDVVQQGLGITEISVVDNSSLISLGDTVLSSSYNTEAFLNTLAQRIGKTIIRFRKYNNKLSGLLLDDFEWGAIVQKIRVAMPDAEQDESYDLVNGEGVDHYKVAKPDVKQKLFVTRTPYQYHITIQRIHLKEAFTGEDAMGRFISAVFGEVQNAIDFAIERLGRDTICNIIAESFSGTGQQENAGRNVVRLATEYKVIDPDLPTSRQKMMNNPDFLRFCISKINDRIDMMQEMSVLNTPAEDALPTFTPKNKMHAIFLSEFERRLETVVQYAAYNEQYTDIGSHETLTYWQNPNDKWRVQVNRASDGNAMNINHIVGILYDRDALGMFKRQEEVVTTPVNAAGLYYNTYYHMKQLWFNDLSENCIIFTLG